jgi:hypothetical protein|tara:strand:+ start:257 stop:742 length:486 start_codon:yes stop_codon:yes gene_type:complete
MADYSKSIIYTIRSKDNLYVGSTVNFRSRKNNHKSIIYNENSSAYTYNLYKIIRENNGEWDMQPYSIFPCNSKLELTIEEERVRQLLKADMNNNACWNGCLTHNEYMKKYRSKFNDQKKDKINKQRRQKITCECGCVVLKRCLTQHHKSKKHLKLIQSVEV